MQTASLRERSERRARRTSTASAESWSSNRDGSGLATISAVSLVSPATRFEASDAKST